MTMDFARVLVVAAIMLGVLYFMTVPQTGLFSIGRGGSGGGVGGSQWKPANREVIPISSPGSGGTKQTFASEFFVGTLEGEALRDLSLPKEEFEISLTPKPTLLASVKDSEIRNGLLSYRNEPIAFQISDDAKKSIKGASLLLNVKDTNSLGSISISLNGESMFNGYLQKGEKIIEIGTEDLLKENIINVEVASSGWKIWAPSIYVIDAEVRVNLLSGSSKEIKFSLSSDEVADFKLGRLVLSPDSKGTGKISMSLNGDEIYAGTPKPGDWIEFKTKPKVGENVLTIVPVEGEYTISLDRLIVFHNTKGKQTIERAIIVSQADYNLLPGAITFKIRQIIDTPSSLGLMLVDPDGDETKFLVTDVLSTNKTVVIEIKSTDLKVGVNKAVISASGEGGFEITDFQVKY